MSSPLPAYIQMRERLLETILTSLRHDERYVAAWLAGSFGRGEQTATSDLDLHVVVTDAQGKVLCTKPWEAGARTTPERLAFFRHFGTPAVVYDSHGNNPFGGTFTYVLYQESAQNVDWMLTPQSDAQILPQTLVLFDKVGLPHAPAVEPEPLEVYCERASLHVGFFWMLAAENVRNLPVGNLCEFHMLLLWLMDHIHEVRSALRGEPARWISNTHSRVYATREEQVAALRSLCDEMEQLMPVVVEQGGYIPLSPRLVIEHRLALLAN